MPSAGIDVHAARATGYILVGLVLDDMKGFVAREELRSRSESRRYTCLTEVAPPLLKLSRTPESEGPQWVPAPVLRIDDLVRSVHSFRHAKLSPIDRRLRPPKIRPVFSIAGHWGRWSPLCLPACTSPDRA